MQTRHPLHDKLGYSSCPRSSKIVCNQPGGRAVSHARHCSNWMMQWCEATMGRILGNMTSSTKPEVLAHSILEHHQRTQHAHKIWQCLDMVAMIRSHTVSSQQILHSPDWSAVILQIMCMKNVAKWKPESF